MTNWCYDQNICYRLDFAFFSLLLLLLHFFHFLLFIYFLYFILSIEHFKRYRKFILFNIIPESLLVLLDGYFVQQKKKKKKRMLEVIKWKSKEKHHKHTHTHTHCLLSIFSLYKIWSIKSTVYDLFNKYLSELLIWERLL